MADPGAAPGDLFGSRVTLSADGGALLVGAPGDHGHIGAAWELIRSGSSWQLEGKKLTGAEEEGKGSFGAGLALSSDAQTAFVGAPSDGPRSPEGGSSKMGAAWAFAFGEASEEENVNQLRPEVAAVSPNEGPTTGGSVVTIRGSRLSEASAVDFGDSSATSFSVVSNGAITAVSPPHPAGTVYVTVTRHGITSSVTARGRFTYADPAATSSAAGIAGAVAGTGAGAQTGVLTYGATSAASCRLSLASRRISVLRGKGSVKVIVRGNGACRGSVGLYVKVRSHRRLTTRRIGAATFSVLAGRVITIRVSLSAGARRMLRSGAGHLGARLLLARTAPAPSLASSASVRLSQQRARR
jgi:hypothetical protein